MKWCGSTLIVVSGILKVGVSMAKLKVVFMFAKKKRQLRGIGGV
jgi:hypothetical protein